jgi:hypothetical protein
MRHRHMLTIDRVGRAGAHRFGREMGDNLMAVEIEIDPAAGAATFAAAEKVTVEAPRGGKIVDRKGKVKRRKGHRQMLRGSERFVETFMNE